MDIKLIKYRANGFFTNKLVEGSVLYLMGTAYIIPLIQDIDLSVLGRVGDDRVFFGKIMSYRIKEDTIRRFTGKYDRNGKELWENDIYRNHSKRNLPIERVRFYKDTGGWSWDYTMTEFGESSEDCYELLGSYDVNPELIDGLGN